jgi:GNAT superfamily N-acetyltransferase
MRIEIATRNDIPRVQTALVHLAETENRLNQQGVYNPTSYGTPGSAEWLTNRIRGGYVALAENSPREIAGCLVGYLTPPEPWRAFEQGVGLIECLFVSEQYRGHGVGSGLVDSFSDWLKERNADVLRTTVTRGNNSAREFYERHEFAPILTEFERKLR